MPAKRIIKGKTINVGISGIDVIWKLTSTLCVLWVYVKCSIQKLSIDVDVKFIGFPSI